MGRALVMLIAVACYFAFFVSFAYLVGWVGGFEFMPTHVNKGLSAAPAAALIIDIGLIALFGVQHSVMARQGFKAGWTKIVPAPLERSLYCLATALVLLVMFEFWHPIEGTLWSIQNENLRMAVWAIFWLGWSILFVSTWLLNHFELFGLQQAWLYLRGKEASPPTMRTPLFYKAVRHPLYTGFFIAFWAAPDMTYSRLLAAIGFTIYILIGIAYEEKDLLAEFGEQYAEYRRKVGSFLPGIGKSD
ncbi:MAG: isoprenylcysteine carboxylmethyltransferase family protein [Alphaproteobacteria bacterium]|nr:MAG: isoprenylcysteine carboxylmethyltransferase family protein [Alphaproteobacteria bacterium]